MSNDTLALDIGDTLQMQFLSADGNARYYVKVIGYAVGKSVLVTAPKIEGRLLIVREGQAIVARLMVGNDVVGFSGSVLRVSSRPYHYLHISYPTDIEAITVRKALRVSISMVASVRPCLEEGKPDLNAKANAVTIVDLSTTGALFYTNEVLGKVADMISISMRINVAGSEDNIMVPAIIRNVRESDPGDDSTNDKGRQLFHGVELQLAERKDMVLLHAFVYEQIVRAHE